MGKYLAPSMEMDLWIQVDGGNKPLSSAKLLRLEEHTQCKEKHLQSERPKAWWELKSKKQPVQNYRILLVL